MLVTLAEFIAQHHGSIWGIQKKAEFIKPMTVKSFRAALFIKVNGFYVKKKSKPPVL